jgi:hypothetical protein
MGGLREELRGGNRDGTAGPALSRTKKGKGAKRERKKGREKGKGRG